LLGVTLTGDLFNLYVFLEITGLAAYALIATKGDGKSAYAALKYMLVGTVGASLYLIGVAYAFIATGTLNMEDLSVRLAEVGHTDTLVVASFGFIVAGLAVKSALYPVHSWQPDAYAAAPYGVAGYVSALVSTVSAYVIGRVVLSVFTVDFLDANVAVADALVYFGALSIVAGSVLAVTQKDVRRMLAYSSVSQFGLIVAAFGIANTAAVFGAVIQLVGHAVMKGALFLGAGILAYKVGEDRLRLRRRSVPPSLRQRRIRDARARSRRRATRRRLHRQVVRWTRRCTGGFWLVAAVIFVSTLLTLAYVLRLVDRMYFGRRDAPEGTSTPLADGGGSAKRVTTGMVVLVGVAAVVSVALGPAASWIETLLRLEEVMR